MQIGNSEFTKPRKQLILPLFEGTEKAPNNSLTGLSRVQRRLVKDALDSKEFDGKKGKKMTLWTSGCNLSLIHI